MIDAITLTMHNGPRGITIEISAEEGIGQAVEVNVYEAGEIVAGKICSSQKEAVKTFAGDMGWGKKEKENVLKLLHMAEAVWLEGFRMENGE